MEDEIAALTEAVRLLSDRVDLAATLNERQKELLRLQQDSTRRNAIMSGLAVLTVAGFYLSVRRTLRARR